MEKEITYDTDRIRDLARKIGEIAEEAAEVDRDTLRPVRQEIPGNFRGSAAEAFTESFSALTREIQTVSSRMVDLQALLNALADRLMEADREMKAAIQAR